MSILMLVRNNINIVILFVSHNMGSVIFLCNNMNKVIFVSNKLPVVTSLVIKPVGQQLGRSVQCTDFSPR